MRALALPDRRVWAVLVASAAVLMLLLPGLTTFDEALTQGALRTGLAGPLQLLAPLVAGQAAALLTLAGTPAAASGSNIAVAGGGGGPVALFLSWNCLGWQALVLLALSLVTGLARPLPLEVRMQVIVAGVVGTYLVNMLRILVVILLAAHAGRVAAIVFHDYAGTLLTLAWLFAFWYSAHRWLMPAAPAAG